jgi:hypothetical protein
MERDITPRIDLAFKKIFGVEGNDIVDPENWTGGGVTVF